MDVGRIVRRKVDTILRWLSSKAEVYGTDEKSSERASLHLVFARSTIMHTFLNSPRTRPSSTFGFPLNAKTFFA
jgi:hypothetical protein